MKTYYVIADGKGKWASYRHPQGPFLTDNRELRYQWDNRAKAEEQLPLYAMSLAVPLKVEEVQVFKLV